MLADTALSAPNLCAALDACGETPIPCSVLVDETTSEGPVPVAVGTNAAVATELSWVLVWAPKADAERESALRLEATEVQSALWSGFCAKAATVPVPESGDPLAVTI